MKHVITTLILFGTINFTFGQNDHVDYFLDSTSYLTITDHDTLKGHHEEFSTSLKDFHFVKRHYFHFYTTNQLKGTNQPRKELKRTFRDEIILKGHYESGRKSGIWTIYNETYGVRPGNCTPIYADYYVTFYQDSIVVVNSDNSKFLFSGNSIVSGIVNPTGMSAYKFYCNEGNCEFIERDSTLIKFGHVDYLKDELYKIGMILKN